MQNGLGSDWPQRVDPNDAAFIAGSSPKASEFIGYFPEWYQTATDRRILLLCRVSGREQERSGNFDNYEIPLQNEMSRRGVRVIATLSEATSGWVTKDAHRPMLKAAVAIAIASQTPILAFSTDRFIRSRAYKNTAQDILPTLKEYQMLRERTQNVTLLTWLHPDLDSRRVRGEEIKLGHDVKGNVGGRPTKVSDEVDKEVRRQKKAQAIEFRCEEGLSLGKIAKQLGIPKSTIQRWVNEIPRSYRAEID